MLSLESVRRTLEPLGATGTLLSLPEGRLRAAVTQTPWVVDVWAARVQIHLTIRRPQWLYVS
jgi:hypothetical protein